ncbi:MAG TPA: hypothetical protein DIC60_02970 [Lachnospiraceae bacterium]|nr:hypothetical protein [Lachnospiraceae bacterium]
MIADYCRISILEVKAFPLDKWLMYRRDAFIYNCEQSEKGRKYLKDAYIMQQKKPDIKRLREVFGEY